MDDETPEYQSVGDTPTAHYDQLAEVSPEIAAEQRSVELSVGSIIGERFEVVSQLGFGGMGAVYKVHDRDLDEDRALKIMLPSLLESEKAQSRFLEEVKISQKLSHYGIVRVHDLSKDKTRGIQFFTMELIEGCTLGRRISEAGGTLPVEETLDIIRQLCDALEYAHQFTIHRDLKPQNIMVQPDGKIKVLDFGLAKLMSPGRMNKSSMALGTAYYQAPEQSVHLTELDKRADIYSLGVIFYQMLTGKIPVGRYLDPSAHNKEVPAYLDKVVPKCLDPEMENRYPDTKAVREALTPSASATQKKSLLPIAAVFTIIIGVAIWYLFTQNEQTDTIPPLRGAQGGVEDTETTANEFDNGTPQESVRDAATLQSGNDTSPTDRTPEITITQVLEAKKLAEAERTAALLLDTTMLMPQEWSQTNNTYKQAQDLESKKEYEVAHKLYTEVTQAFIKLQTATRAANLEKLEHDNAVNKLDQAKSEADLFSAQRLAKDLYTQAQTAQSNAVSIKQRPQRTAAYKEAALLYLKASEIAEPFYLEERNEAAREKAMLRAESDPNQTPESARQKEQ